MPLTEEDALERARERWYTPPEEIDDGKCRDCNGNGFFGGANPVGVYRRSYPKCPTCDGTGDAQ